MTPAASSTPSPQASGTLGNDDGPPRISDTRPCPNPNPRSIAVHLEGRVDELELRIYSVSMRCLAVVPAGAAPAGWSQIPLPTDLDLANGLQFYTVSARRAGRDASRTTGGRFLVLR